MHKLPAPLIVILTFLGLFFLIFAGLGATALCLDLGSSFRATPSPVADFMLMLLGTFLSSLCFSILICEVRDK